MGTGMGMVDRQETHQEMR